MIRIVIWIFFLVGGGLGGIICDFKFFQLIIKNPLFHAISLFFGFFLIRLVMRSSKNTGRFLSRYGRDGELPRMETNRLVTDGIYSCMRHPMHLGLLFFPISLALIIGSVSFILFIAPAEMILMLVMIKFIEEPEAIKKFGDEYRNYKKRVPFFSFKISCLKILLEKKNNL